MNGTYNKGEITKERKTFIRYLKEMNHFEYLHIDGSVSLKCVLKE
jgi:hypothetical protein